MTTIAELAGRRPADAVLLKIEGPNPVDAFWTRHRQGHRSVVALSLVARIRVVLRFSGWLERHPLATAS